MGVVAMFSAILALAAMPFTDLSRSRGLQFRPLSKANFFLFVANFLILMLLGAKHVESPYIELGQICTTLYFAHFFVTVPFIGMIENSLIELHSDQIKNKYLSLRKINNWYIDYNTFKSEFSISFIFSVFILITLFNNFSNFFTFQFCDAPTPWGIYFQDSATPQMEGLVELHDNVMFYLSIVLFTVGWILVSIVRKFTNAQSLTFLSSKYTSHGTSVELIWTIIPALILIFIAFPSFKLLYLMDEVSDPAMVVLAEGHQWYWSYQYPDFLNGEEEFIEFDSYLIPESDLEDGALRMLEVDNRVIIPELTHVRFVVTGADVIHSFACPALGIKCDAYPGRLNQMSVFVNREGIFYGQCSEICGILHSSMPIVIESISVEKFVSWVKEQ